MLCTHHHLISLFHKEMRLIHGILASERASSNVVHCLNVFHTAYTAYMDNIMSIEHVCLISSNLTNATCALDGFFDIYCAVVCSCYEIVIKG